MVLTRAQNQPGPDGILGNGDDVQNADQHRLPVGRPVPDLRLARLAPGLPARVRRQRGRPAGVHRQAARWPRRRPDVRRLARTAPTGMGTWAAVKKQAADMLGIQLRDRDVTNVPMLATDPYGKFLPGPDRGLPQYVTKRRADRVRQGSRRRQGHAGAGRRPALRHPVRGRHRAQRGPLSSGHRPQPRDPAGRAGPRRRPHPVRGLRAQPPGTYDDEMLDSHFTCGDGRCNENIALSAIHQVFHSEHDRLVAQIKDVLNARHDRRDQALRLAAPRWGRCGSGQLERRAALPGRAVHQRDGVPARRVRGVRAQGGAGHLGVRRLLSGRQPRHQRGVRAGGLPVRPLHARRGRGAQDADPTTGTTKDDSVPLLTAFLNPPEYFAGGATGTLTPQQAAGSVIMGSSDQAGNEIDEFVTETLRNNLLGLPTDLAAINIARSRESGIPPLNDVRAQIEEATNDSSMAPYESWTEFGQQLKHPESLVNFVAAYGRHPTILVATTLAAKRAAARAIVDPQPGDVPPADAADFMLGEGDWHLSHGETKTGIEDVDLWVGGLAEATSLNGGMLGSTFSYVFEKQLTDLQDGDRFYYLNRTAGMNLLSQLEGNSFAEMIQRNTDGTSALKADAFSTVDCRFDLAHLDGTPDGFAHDGADVADDPTSECNEHLLLQRRPDGTIAYRAIEQRRPERHQRAGRVRRHLGRRPGVRRHRRRHLLGWRGQRHHRGEQRPRRRARRRRGRRPHRPGRPRHPQGRPGRRRDRRRPRSRPPGRRRRTGRDQRRSRRKPDLRRSGQRLRHRRRRDGHGAGRRRRRLDPRW